MIMWSQSDSRGRCRLRRGMLKLNPGVRFVSFICHDKCQEHGSRNFLFSFLGRQAFRILKLYADSLSPYTWLDRHRCRNSMLIRDWLCRPGCRIVNSTQKNRFVANGTDLMPCINPAAMILCCCIAESVHVREYQTHPATCSLPIDMNPDQYSHPHRLTLT